MSDFRFHFDPTGVLKRRLKPLAEGMAILVKDEIRLTIEEASPSGRTYPSYTASAPGEPPAVREARYRDSWKNTPAVEVGSRVVATAYSDLRVGPNGEYLLGELLEHGSHDLVNYRVRMEPRPHVAPAMETVRPKLEALLRAAKRRPPTSPGG